MSVSYEMSLWVASGLFGALFVALAAINVHVMFIVPRRLKDGQRGASPVPMLGGIFGLNACLMSPSETLRWMAWLPLLLDPGCLPLLWIALKSLRRETAEALMRVDEPEVAALRRVATGCLLGTAVGDALGLAGEGMSRRRIQRVFPDTTHYHLLPGKGMCSDDTEHACMTAQAFLAAQKNAQRPSVEVFTHSLAARLRWWLLGLPAGVGLATGRAIIKLWLGWPAERAGVNSAGNGPAMRAPILGVLLGHDPGLLRAFVRASTRLTHTDPRAEQGALAVAQAAYLSSCGSSASDAGAAIAAIKVLLGEEATEFKALLEQVEASVAQGQCTEDFAATMGCDRGVSGYMLHTVPVALHAWLSHPDDLPAALSAVIRCGGETDSVAAVVGGIVGARVGREGIPAHLLADLWEWPRSTKWIEQLGAMLGVSRSASEAAFVIWLNVPGVLLRNLFFFCLVLAHGLRRLLPPY